MVLGMTNRGAADSTSNVRLRLSILVRLLAGVFIACVLHAGHTQLTAPMATTGGHPPADSQVSVLVDIVRVPGGLQGRYSDGRAVMCFDNITVEGDCQEDSIDWP